MSRTSVKPVGLGEPWVRVSLGDCVVPKTRTVIPSLAANLPYVGLEHLDSGSTMMSRHGQASEVRSAKTLFTAGDLLYGKLRPYLDKAVIADRDGICSTDILVFRAREGIDSEYLSFLLHTQVFRQYATASMTGVNHPRTSWPKLKRFEFDLPPPEEQRAIAHLLGTVQRAKEESIGVRDAAKTLRGSLFAHFFADTSTWHTERLTDVVIDILDHRGRTPKKLGGDFATSGVPVISAINIKEGRVSLQERLRFIDEEMFQRWMPKTLRRDDILLTSEAPVGAVALLKSDALLCIGQRLFALRPDKGKVEPRFLYHTLRSRQTQRLLIGRSRGSTALGISQAELRQLRVGLPPVHEQIWISDVLDAVDRKVDAEEQLSAGLDSLFKTLIQELVTGERRVRDISKVA